MFDWFINWLFPPQKEYKPNIEVYFFLPRGFSYKEAENYDITSEAMSCSCRLPQVEELQYLAKNKLISDEFVSAWCKDNYGDVYAYVVYAGGGRKKCDKNEFHQVVLVRDI